MHWSEDQQTVIGAIQAWRSSPWDSRHPYLTVGGLAGTGKTTIVSHIVNTWKGVSTAALCGKAAHVLRSKGVDAQTLHSLIYVPYEDEETGKVRFKKREFLEGTQTIVVDEASMVDKWLMTDLLSFNVPVLFVGDHGQLEPIGSNPKLMVNPTLRLEKIHRQAHDNPILRLAHAFREGRNTPHWTDPRGRLTLRGKAGAEALAGPDAQVICGFNATRHEINATIRRKLGYTAIVEAGEKLLCLKNNKHFGIFNGQQMTCHGIVGESRRTLDLDIQTDDDRRFTMPCLRKQFGANLVEGYDNPEVALLDYGWCLTAHKSQGSEWDRVLVIEQVSRAWDARRWRYTAATRARNQLTYCA